MNLREHIKELYIGVIICWIVLAIIFGLTDLEISIALVNRASIWANIGKYYGEGPGYGIIAIAIAIFIGSYNKDIKKQKIPGYVIMLIGVFFFILGLIIVDLWYVVFGGSIMFSLLVFIILTLNRDWTEFKTISMVIILLAIINPLLVVQTTKILSGRVRFNNLASDYSNYTPWFLPPGPLSGIKGNASFPSGHTAIGWMFLPLLIQVRERKWSDPIRILITLFVIGFGLFLGISRIVTGDHFASDILFSTGVAIIATIWLYKRYYIDKNN